MSKRTNVQMMLLGVFLMVNCLNVVRGQANPPGVCSLEVPTADLLTPEDRRLTIPRGNGTRTGFSKIQICCTGWKHKPHQTFACEPVCDIPCDNGNCTAPNICVCNAGYTKGPDNRCIPTCPRGCLNGVCTVQRTCSCNAGYATIPTGEYCVPQCVGGCGIGGDCTAPGVCSCRPGFTQDPVTRRCGYYCAGGCPGGECIGPNQCSCGVGYSKINNACVPDCPRGCLNGVCAGPNRCTCSVGWNLDASGTSCKAHCSLECLNADCTGPNVCTCKPGYIKNPNAPNSNHCVAHCPGGCENGECSAPNFCICKNGYIKESRTSQRCIRRTRRSALHMELIPEQLD